ncbi:nuclear intron maturase 3, mitochondrial [Amaranthus tricolor]|uniref:nuclear intron maturase 3, mitochondrial n=1 Tax=Amaranthus tricolor TaxID=29722 RepID=UPI00258EC5DC|nr:nuclear intron maturase 3, mitochondrial [Amaranthus tricolor]
MVFALTRRLSKNPSFLPFSFSPLYSTISQSLSFDQDFDFQPLTKPQLKTLLLSHYNNGKFSSLLQNVVASPSVLFTASQNLTRSSQLTLNSVSTRFNLFQLAHELTHNEFNPESCCVRLYSPQQNGNDLVLPNLKLKVVIEALRIVLDLIYDGAFPTFVYGGRDGLGCHTAVRYMKNYVENPSWWFTVGFNKANFDSIHLGKLCSILANRIDDVGLINLIEKLFECGVVRIELGGIDYGKGLPQECGLCGILFNIYLNSFDRKIQRIRLRMNDENPKFDCVNDVVVYNPLKVYAVRYYDNIMLIISGPKIVGMDLLNWVVKYLEEELELKVDRLRTIIHSAVSEKIEFLGMEFQAVSPSVLRPPLSDKAKRARLKFRRQKEVRAKEMKNARERNRRKLGMKIFSHVFKKLKNSNDGFKFEYRIEDEVRQIFRTWADEVVHEFFESLDEKWSWHRELTSGDFLSLKRIRDQLPKELVDAYDKFQEEVDKHLNPMKARKALEEVKKNEEEEEERKYSERTVSDLTKLCMKVTAPIDLIRKAVRLAGFTNDMGRPRPISLLVALEDADIVKWYAGVGRRWLEYFSCCRNFEMVRTVVTYHLRFSCLLTLAEKHNATKNQTIRHYSKDLKVFDLDGNEEIYFPTEREVKRARDSHLSDPKPVDGALTLALIRLAYDMPSNMCAAHFCDCNNTITYRVCLLQNRVIIDPRDQKQKWVPGLAAFHDSLDRRCYALCSHHASDLYMGRITLQDIDCTSFVDVD